MAPSTDDHPFIPATPADSRSPCPALNALANHGYLPRDGRNLTATQLIAALREVYHISWPFAAALSYGGVLRCGADGRLDLHALAAHDVIEHDASLVHVDAAPGAHDAPVKPDPVLLHRLLSASEGDVLTREDLIRVRAERYAASPPLNGMQTVISEGELALIWEVFGRHGSEEACSGGGSHGKEAVVPKEFLEQWFGEERLPDGWKKPARAVGLFDIVSDVRAVSRELGKAAGPPLKPTL